MNTKTTIAFLFTVLTGGLLLCKGISGKTHAGGSNSNTSSNSKRPIGKKTDAVDIIDYPGSWIFDLNQ